MHSDPACNRPVCRCSKASVSAAVAVADFASAILNPLPMARFGLSLTVALLQTSTLLQTDGAAADVVPTLTQSVSSAVSSSASASTTVSGVQQLLFVNPIVGNDASGDGSQRSPFRTITHALQLANANTVILLAAGTYSTETGEVFPLQLKPDVTVQGDPSTQGRGIIIRGSGTFVGTGSTEHHATILGADRAQLIGVTVTNPSEGYGLWSESSAFLVANNTFTSSPSQAISTRDDRSAVMQNRFARHRTAAAIGGPTQTEASQARSLASPPVVQSTAAITQLPPAVAAKASTITTPPPLMHSTPAVSPTTATATSTPPAVTTSAITPPITPSPATTARSHLTAVGSPSNQISANQISALPPTQPSQSSRNREDRSRELRQASATPVSYPASTVAHSTSAAHSATVSSIAISVPPPVTTSRQSAPPSSQQPVATVPHSSLHASLQAVQPASLSPTVRSQPVSSSYRPARVQSPTLTPPTATAPTTAAAIEIPVPPPETSSTATLAYAAPATASFQTPIEIPVPLPSSAILPTRAPSQAISPPTSDATPNIAAAQDVLPVPMAEIPVGNVGDMPRVSVAGTPSPWSSGTQLASHYARASLRYRVVVDASSQQTQSLVQAIVPDAFVTWIGGQSLMQVGAFSDRTNAEQAVQRLNQNGLVAVIHEVE